MMAQESTSNRVEYLLKKIREFEAEVGSLRSEVKTIQETCTHTFEETSLMKKCSKCNYIESLYY